MFNSSLGLGQVLGPLFGAPVYASVGFRTMEDIMAFICIGFSILYFIFAGGMTAFKRTFSKKARAEAAIESKAATIAAQDDDDAYVRGNSMI